MGHPRTLQPGHQHNRQTRFLIRLLLKEQVPEQNRGIVIT